MCVSVCSERGGVCLPTIAAPPLIVCQGFDEESHCASFLHDNSPPSHTHARAHTYTHTHIPVYTFARVHVGNSSIPVLLHTHTFYSLGCLRLLHIDCILLQQQQKHDRRESREAVRKKDLARLQAPSISSSFSSSSSIGGSPPVLPSFPLHTPRSQPVISSGHALASAGPAAPAQAAQGLQQGRAGGNTLFFFSPVGTK